MPFLPHDKALLVPCLQVFGSLVVVGLVSTEIFVLNKARWMFHLSQSFTNEQKPFCEQGEHAEKSGPSPIPSPEGKGHNHRDTHVANHQHLTPITQHPSEASPPAPLRMEKGVITEVTPTSLFVS